MLDGYVRVEGGEVGRYMMVEGGEEGRVEEGGVGTYMMVEGGEEVIGHVDLQVIEEYTEIDPEYIQGERQTD